MKAGIRASPPDGSSVFGERVMAETAIVLALDQDADLATVRLLMPCVELCPAGRQAKALSYSRDSAGELTAGLHLSR